MRTFSSRMSSAANDTGRSIVRMLSTCSKSMAGANQKGHNRYTSGMMRTVLEDVTDDTELIEVPAATLSTERLLEGDLDVADRMFVPERAERNVGEAEH